MLNFETFLDINKNLGILFIANEKINQRIGFSNNWPTLKLFQVIYNVHDALHFVNNSKYIIVDR